MKFIKTFSGSIHKFSVGERSSEWHTADGKMTVRLCHQYLCNRAAMSNIQTTYNVSSGLRQPAHCPICSLCGFLLPSVPSFGCSIHKAWYNHLREIWCYVKGLKRFRTSQDLAKLTWNHPNREPNKPSLPSFCHGDECPKEHIHFGQMTSSLSCPHTTDIVSRGLSQTPSLMLTRHSQVLFLTAH